MEATHTIQHLLKDIREIKKRLDDIEIEILKLQAQMLEEEEIDPKIVKKAYKEAKELIQKGELLTVEEALKELDI